MRYTVILGGGESGGTMEEAKITNIVDKLCAMQCGRVGGLLMWWGR
jgi:hypothetical protein